jgi:putative ABC transport system ATP-binding protein
LHLPRSGAVLELTDLVFQFRGQNEPVLNISSWTVSEGDSVFLQGQSGSGKSTLLALLSGLEVPTRGDVSVLGHSVSSMNSRERDRFRANRIGVVFQQFNLIPFLSVIDNILLAAQFAETQLGSARDRAEELLTRVGLGPSLYRRHAAELSIGQQQRVAIVRALINQPALLLVDEPTSALDQRNRDNFLELLLEILDESDCSMVFVSHDPTIAQKFDHRIELSEINQVSRFTG